MVKVTKKYKESFASDNKISNFIDEALSWFPFYFRYVINFFRFFIEKGMSGDFFYFIYLFCIFIIIKMYIRGRVVPVQELYYESIF